jgi:hypothetical protein
MLLSPAEFHLSSPAAVLIINAPRDYDKDTLLVTVPAMDIPTTKFWHQYCTAIADDPQSRHLLVPARL